MNQSSQSGLLRFIGYGLLILSIIDLIDTFVPLRLMDPLWQFQTFGQLVERVPVPLIGLSLVFYGARNRRTKWEKSLLNILSWGALLAGIGYIILVPLGLFSTLQIDRSGDNQFKQQIAQGMTQIESIKSQLKEVKTEAQMQALLNSIQGLPPEIKEFQQLEDSKQKLTAFITKGADGLMNQLKQTYFERRLQLLKESVKWNLGSLVSGVLFMGIWQMTKWARSIKMRE